jgi:hypothetical protein
VRSGRVRTGHAYWIVPALVKAIDAAIKRALDGDDEEQEEDDKPDSAQAPAPNFCAARRNIRPSAAALRRQEEY